MRTNIDIDDALMEAAMRAGPYSTKREAVEAGLRLLARKAAYRDILALRGKLQWDDGPLPPGNAGTAPTATLTAHSPKPPPYANAAPTAPKISARKARAK
jgi:hypothetical protein